MLSVFDQENLTSTHAANAANKPLNQGVRALLPKTPGPAKTPFGALNNENALLVTGQAGKNAFVTPAPRTNRAPLGAKTTNAKVQAFQTPAAKPFGNDRTVQKSSTRRTTKKKIYVEPEPIVEPEVVPEQEEPDFGFAPPDVTPLPDIPLDFSEIDQTYPELEHKTMCKEIRQYYFQSPKDENGFSLSLKKQEREAKLSLERDLAHIAHEHIIKPVQEDLDNARSRIPTRLVSEAEPQSARVDTIRARAAASSLTQISKPRTHLRLPSAVTKETAASRQKRKPNASTATETKTVRAPFYTSTIGFPKAKKPASILPTTGQSITSRTVVHKQTPSHSLKEFDDHTVPENAIISPRKFMQLYGTPDVETDMWCKLKELEIRDRRREDGDEDSKTSTEDNTFDFEIDDDLDYRLAAQSGIPDDFELSLDDL